MNALALMATLGLDSSEYEKGLSSAEKSANSFGRKIGNTFKKAGKAVAVGLAASATAVSALTKVAVDSYAEYEQLVGGVETLFGAGGKSREEYSATASNSFDTIGDDIEDVMELQKQLIAQGYDLGESGADGIYGPKTQAAFEAYRKDAGKTSTDAQEKYNQLMRAQNIVLDNADKAYRTAGLSANDYMETVTSFSASLIQSLGGDTEKAAKYADMAIIDMSDNANKMGTNMESIQAAYSGFAKQNYTMLDNLKLGYGGTKTEMERLIKDAENLDSSFKASRDSNGDLALSYADVVDAIHIVQTEMQISGITAEEAAELVKSGAMTESEAFALMGTTAKEAQTTITGSTDSMKAAWENLLVAIASGTGDFSEQMNALVDSASTAFNNILPIALNFITGFADLMKEVGPLIVEKLPLIIEEVVPELLNAAVSIVASLVEALPGILEALVTVAASVVDSISAALNERWPTLGAAFDAAVSIAINALNAISDFWYGTLQPTFQSILDWVGGLLSPVFDTLAGALNGDEEAMSKVNKVLSIAIPIVGGIAAAILAYKVVVTAAETVTLALEAAQALLNGTMALNPIGLVVAAIAGLVVAFKLAWEKSEKFREIVTNAWEAIKTTAEEVWTAVSDFVTNAWDTIKTKSEEIWDTLTTFFSDTWDSINTTLTTAWDAIVTFFSDTWDSINGTITEVWEDIKTFFSDTCDSISTTLTDAWDAITTFFSNTWENISTALTDAWNTIITFFSDTWESINNTLTDVWNNIITFFSDTWDSINTTITDVWNTIVTFFSDTWDSINTALTTAWEAITTFFSDTWDSINTTLTEMWNNITTFLTGIWDGLSSAAESLFSNINSFMDTYLKPVFDWIHDTFAPVFDAVQTAFTNFKDWLSGTFTDDWESAWNGIVDGFSTIFQKIEDFVKAPINAVIDAINAMISGVESAINWVIGGINDHLKIDVDFGKNPFTGKPLGGIHWGANLSTVELGRVANLAEGGTLGNGQSAYVGEFQPEILTVQNGVATVQPIKGNPYQGLEDAIDNVVSSRLDIIIEKISDRMNIVMDTGALVGATASEMDAELNRIAAWKGSGRA